MPNTDPVVDSAAVLSALVARAQDEAVVPTGFMAAISKGQGGEELTEMAELSAAGAAAFTDDGHPVVSSGLLRRALQYSALAQRPLALHCEDPALSRGGHAHEGAVAAELGLGGYPAVAESVMVERDLSLAAFEERPLHVMHISARESVSALRAAQAAGVQATGEVTPHHLCLTDEALRTLDPNVKMNPPLRSEDDRRALIEALRDGTICAVATDHAPHARQEKEAPFEEAPFGVTGLETAFSALYTQLVRPGLDLAGDAPRAHVGGSRSSSGARHTADRGRGTCQPRGARPRGGMAGAGGRLPLAVTELLAARRDAARTRRPHDRRRAGGVLGMTAGYIVLEDGTTFRGRSVGAPGAALGEAVFTTAMTGYQETVTDPSYAEQLVCFTAPMIGNYGVSDDRDESGRAHAKAVVMRRLGGRDWADWLSANGLVGLEEIDTRALVLRLRDGGAMRAAAVADEAALPVEAALAQVREQPGMEGQALVAHVSAASPYVFDEPQAGDGGETTVRGSRSSTTARSDRSCAGSFAPEPR